MTIWLSNRTCTVYSQTVKLICSPTKFLNGYSLLTKSGNGSTFQFWDKKSPKELKFSSSKIKPLLIKKKSLRWPEFFHLQKVTQNMFWRWKKDNWAHKMLVNLMKLNFQVFTWLSVIITFTAANSVLAIGSKWGIHFHLSLLPWWQPSWEWIYTKNSLALVTAFGAMLMSLT